MMVSELDIQLSSLSPTSRSPSDSMLCDGRHRFVLNLPGRNQSRVGSV